MSPFDDAFKDLRISGSVLLTGTHGAPWAVDIPGEEKLRTPLKAGPDQRVIPFHLVRRGRFELVSESGQRVEVGRNEVVLCPGGHPHRMRLGAGASPIPFGKILSGEIPQPCWNGETEMTELICGAFLVQSTPLNPLLSALPPVLTCPTDEPRATPMLARVTEMLALEVQTPDRQADGFTRARLLEIFCAEVIRAGQSDHSGQTGWFKGLSDPKVAKALAQIHADPAAPWTVERLAQTVALSPSRFAARFRDTVGVTAMSYVARWRMNLACRMLREGDASIDNIAERIGYGGTAAFARAFKDHVGTPPSRWRAQAS